MDIDAYAIEAQEFGFYPKIDNTAWLYPALGLVGETGELAEKVKKLFRDHGGNLGEGVRMDLLYELGDVLWYVNALVNEIWPRSDDPKTASPLGTIVAREVQKCQPVNIVEPTWAAFDEIMRQSFDKYESSSSLAGHAIMLGADVGHIMAMIVPSYSHNSVMMRILLGHVITRIAHIAYALSSSMDNVATINLTKLRSRKKRGVLGGVGDRR